MRPDKFIYIERSMVGYRFIIINPVLNCQHL
jgi:hypothetical protein